MPEDDETHVDALPPSQAMLLKEWDKVKAKGGQMFALSQQLGNSEGIEMTGDAITAVARRVAEGSVEAQQKVAQNAILAAAVGAPTRSRGHARAPRTRPGGRGTSARGSRRRGQLEEESSRQPTSR